MNVIVYGFGLDVSKYHIQELYQYLLIFGVLVMMAGRFLARRKIDKDYFSLIRYGAIANWWYRQAWHAVIFGGAEAVVLFLTAILWFWITGESFQRYMWIAFFLWLVGLITIHLLQLLLIQFRNGDKFSFLFIMLLEVLSLYYVFFPGSFLMIRRSCLMTAGGFSVWIVIIVSLFIDVLLVWKGFRLVMQMGERRKIFQNQR